MDIKKIMADLALILKPEQILTDVSMKLHTSFRVGGPAALLTLPENEAEIVETLRICKAAGTAFFILGNGTNIIVKDAGFDGVIIKLGDRFSRIAVDGNRITAEAGALLAAVSRQAADESLAGLEFAGGIPGSIGGAVAMNAGAYGGEIKNVLESARCLYADGSIKELSCEALMLSYRHSLCQEEGLIVLSAVFKLAKDMESAVKERTRELLKLRNEKQPVQWPSAGSVFKRPEGHYAGQLIEEAGLKGLMLGGARVSPMHAGFIVNEHEAKAKDILDLISLIKLTVLERTGILLQEEIKILGVDDDKEFQGSDEKAEIV